MGTLNCIYSKYNSIQYRRRVIRFIEVNCFGGPGVFMNIYLLHLFPDSGLQVPLSTKYFVRLNKSLHLFEMHCAFVPLLNPNINLLQALKVTKSGHHLSHDRASKGYGSTPCLTSQTSLRARLQRLNTMQISL